MDNIQDTPNGPVPKMLLADPATGLAQVYGRRYPVLVMKTGAGQVNGSAPGWLSGNPASLAGNATAVIVFDLGPNWEQYGLLQLAVRATVALASLSEDASDDGSTKVQPLIAANGAALTMTLAAAGDVVASALPSGRFIIITIVNGGGAQGATAAVRLTAHPA